MALTIDVIKKWIFALGFVPIDGEADVYHKVYEQHNGYALRVDFQNKSIEYIDDSVDSSAQITVWDKSTSNFAKSENLVVLECIDRLLEKGYSPSCIELEKVYPSGRGHSGELDILVNNEKGQAFLMIECKTWGKEYTKEVEKMLANGGQLFTYFKNATSAESLCLYSSHLVDGDIEYENSIVNVSEDWRTLSETKDIYERWNKIFKNNGIFEEYASPFNIVYKKLTYGDLVNIKDDDKKKIINQIEIILRLNGISDRPNAFNKLLNLFVCKIIDEEKNNPTDELKFQTWAGLKDEDLQMALNDLYKNGMERFLNIDVIDLTTDDIEKMVSNSASGDRMAERERLIDLRLKKSPTFAFIEVLDNKTFILNAKIVREIVELLQRYKFRYEQKHEILGEFFEILLNDSMKQEVGQFFTPVIITRFIISAMPLKELVQKNIDEKETEPLPTVIDYACGSGHFLTEFMAQMQNIIQEVDIEQATRTVKGKMNSWRGDVKYLWAKDYVYGIDFDNRLVKTTKVSAFFNGDGEANIVWANGLDSFEYAVEYCGKLRKTLPGSKRDNGQFDILISNPPFSVPSFKNMLKYGADSFELFNGLTDKSKEIECLFVERMKQLLKIGGWAGVILPISILSSDGIHLRAREIIFKYFKIRAIVVPGEGTFMETGTKTIILFLERRADSDHEKITQAINRFFINKRDVTVLGIERAFSDFVANVYDELNFEDYVSFLSKTPSNTMKNHELYRDYITEFGDTPYSEAFRVEKEKMLYFLLTHNQDIVVAKSGSKKEDISRFLGYKFSKRRNNEGIEHLPKGTMLFDDEQKYNPKRVNSYIRNAFLGNTPVAIDEKLANYVFYGRMSGFFDYGTSKFNKKANLTKNIKMLSKYPFESISSCVNIIRGVTYTKKDRVYEETANAILTADNITNNGNLEITKKIFLHKEKLLDSDKKLCKGDIFICFSSGSTEHIGKSVYIENDTQYYAGGFMGILRKSNDNIDMKYLWIVLSSLHYRQIISQSSTGANINNLSSEIGNVKIPMPPLEIQCQLVTDFKKIEKEKQTVIKRIQVLQEQLLYKKYFNFGEQRIGDISVMVKRGKSAKYGRSGTQIIKSGQARGFLDFDFSQRYYVSEDFISDDRNLIKGDILINSTGVGTAGRVTLFNLDGDFVVDSHITIVRLDNSRINPKYALYALANIGFKTIEEMATGQSGQIEISLDIIKSIRIPCPPLKKQNEIVLELEKNENEIATLQKKLNELNIKQGEILKKHL